ncbi:rho GTPase-activating protein gacO-like [Astatotilapia calliptera]|uniref:rho GTPase-activating protein gacO-like n=1 Tax=Astatotilapia calliptera TaxID=8154 RepID=UPI000E4164A7|nr:rho GTPase-activating protein gacO-like [Astatotilapia calliptera]
MDYAEGILSLTTTIKKMADTMKSNKERCRRITERVKAVERLVLNITQSDPSQISDTVDGALRELYVILNSAKDLIAKFSQTKSVKTFFKAGNIEEKFSEVNQRLTENFQVLSGALQIEHTTMLQKVYEAVSRQNTEEEVCSMMANTSLTPLMLPSSPVSSPTASIFPPSPVSRPLYPELPPTPVSSPTASVLPPLPVPSPIGFILPPAPLSSPTASMSQPAPLSGSLYPQLPPTPVSSPTNLILPSMPVSAPFAAQPLYNTTTSHFIVNNNIASTPVIQAISQGSVTDNANTMPVFRTVRSKPTSSCGQEAMLN